MPNSALTRKQNQQPTFSVDQKEIPEQNQRPNFPVNGSSLPGPDLNTVNRLWNKVIGAFVLIMMTSVVVLAIQVFRLSSPEIGCQTILTIFTTTASFLAGLFITSPIQPRM